MSGRWYGRAIMALLAWGVLAFGAVYPWAYVPLDAAAAATGVWGFVVTRGWRDPRMRRMAAACAIVLAVMVLQAIPLPVPVTSTVSPGVERFFRLFEIGYRPPAVRAFSLSPAATLVDLAGATAWALLLLGTARALRGAAVEWFAGQLMGLGVAVATVGILQKALGPADHVLVYGFWRPEAGGNPFGPFVNRNHFAGWMVMVIPVVAAYAVGLARTAAGRGDRDAGRWLRWGSTLEGNRCLLASASVLIMSAAVVLTRSRSGLAALATACVVLGVCLARTLRGRARAVGVAALGLMLVTAVAWGGAGLVAARFGRAPAELAGRLSAWRDTVRIVRDFPLVGTGLGTYGQAMLVYQTQGRERMYADAHNDYLQLLAEGGLALTGAALAVLIVWAAGVRKRLRAGDDDPLTFWVRRGALAGLAGIAAQSLVEFSLQMPGNAALFVVLAAVALHRPRSVTHAHRV